MSKQSNQRYRKEVEKKKNHSSENSTGDSHYQVSSANTGKDNTYNSSKNSGEKN